MAPVYARIVHEGKIQTVALIEGIDTEELVSLLKTVFSVSGNIVGLLAEGLILPISLVSRSPSIVPDTLCKLLVSTDSRMESTYSRTSQPVANSAEADEESDEEDENEEDDDEAEEQEESTEFVIKEILRFIDGIKEREIISDLQARLLEQLLMENSSTLLFAAYSVAISANDSEYMAEICKDLSTSLQTREGRIACEAQDEVLQVCDQLYLSNKITENQLLYLRHLVLIRDESVAQIYDDFQDHQNVAMLAKALYDHSNTHPFMLAQQEEEEAEDEEEDDDDDEEENTKLKDTDFRRSPKESLTGAVALMIRSKVVTNAEANVLIEMIRGQNEYVMAAYELYESDDNLEELQDTLLRCAKLEIRKRLADQKEAQLSEQEKAVLNRNEDTNESSGSDSNGGSESDDEHEDDSDQDEGLEDETEANFSLEDIGLDTIMESLRVENIWKNSVPEKFLLIVFVAVIQRHLEVGQAKALCDLYQAEYDLVRAAWEVYTVQSDVIDFIDTLKRVVRDLDFDRNGDVAMTDRDRRTNQSKREDSEEESDEDSGENDEEDDEEKDEDREEEITNVKSSTASDEATKIDRRNEALAAVASAKKELLKHSLEMMVKQGMTSAEDASNLYARYLSGDMMIEAAIDSYAADREVAEFLTTLRILSSHTTEELQEMMKQASSGESPKKTNASASTSTNSPGSPYSSSDSTQLQLRGIVAELSRNKMIDVNLAAQLLHLINNKDNRVMAAYGEYTQKKDGAQLIDSLLKIGAGENSSVNQDEDNEDDDEDDDDEDENESDDNADETSGNQSSDRPTLLNASDQKTVVEILSRANAITPSQNSRLMELIDAGDKEIQKIFSQYESDKNVYQLIDTLKTVDISENDDEQQINGDDNVQDDDDGDDNDEDGGETVEQKFLSIVQNMQLTNLETAGLRLAIAKDDNAVRQSIETFRSDNDQDNLMDNLRSIARATIAETMSENQFDYTEEVPDAEEVEESPETIELLHRPSTIESHLKNGEYERKHDSAKNTQSAVTVEDVNDNDDDDDDEEDDDDDNDDDDDDDEDYDGDDNEDEGPGRSVMTSQSARAHVFPILISELVKESILTKETGASVSKQFQNGSAVINAALDLYDLNNDMAQLVENLMKAAASK